MDRKEKKNEAHMAEPQYEVYVRLPFNRGAFVDPPPVDWDENKSDVLWSIISDVELAKDRKIDWNELAVRFGVGVDFLIMMAQTLAERHMDKVRGLFRMAPGVGGSGAAPSPTSTGFPGGIAGPDAATVAGEVMRRTGSGGGRPVSQLSIRKDTPGGSGLGTPAKVSANIVRPPVGSRNSSSSTTVLTQNTRTPSGPRPKSPLHTRQHRLAGLQVSTAGTDQPLQNAMSPTSPTKSTSSSSSSSDSSSPVQSRIIKRPPRFQPQSPDGDGEDEDSEPAFLPYRGTTSAGGSSSGATTTPDLGATLRGDPRGTRRPQPGTSSVVSEKTDHSQTSDSSASSAAMVPRQGGHPKNRQISGPGPGASPLSPRRTAELAGRSPRGRLVREGSDGAPSMGSSFSDLDDASVTQSALEEALASRMQDGGGTIGSRMSTFGQAIRSRYLPKGTNQSQPQPQQPPPQP